MATDKDALKSLSAGLLRVERDTNTSPEVAYENIEWAQRRDYTPPPSRTASITAEHLTQDRSKDETPLNAPSLPAAKNSELKKIVEFVSIISNPSDVHSALNTVSPLNEGACFTPHYVKPKPKRSKSPTFGLAAFSAHKSAQQKSADSPHLSSINSHTHSKPGKTSSDGGRKKNLKRKATASPYTVFINSPPRPRTPNDIDKIDYAQRDTPPSEIQTRSYSNGKPDELTLDADPDPNPALDSAASAGDRDKPDGKRRRKD